LTLRKGKIMNGKGILLVWIIAAVAIGMFMVDAAVDDPKGAPSNVTVSAQIAISLSTNLSNGIFNLSLETGTDNTSDPGMGGSATLGTTNAGNNVTVVGNAVSRLCIATPDGNLSLPADGTTQIPSFNYTYQGTSNVTNLSTLQRPHIAFGPGTGYAEVNGSIDGESSSQVTCFGFWVDIPGSQAIGEYNNTVSFKVIRDTTTC